jgi:hypothetical protein
MPLKQQIRDIYKIDKSSVHINDTHDETIRIAQFAFNSNSIHFANNATPVLYPAFQKILDDYTKTDKDSEHFCVTGSAVMAMYGIRAAKDVDYFNKYQKLNTNNSLISSHNNEIRHYTITMDDILYNPENHFWFCGTKFAALHIIKALKEKRNEIPKDVEDIKIMSLLKI